MANDYGTAPASYTPDVNAYSGLIGKIAKQLITGQTFNSKFASLFKDPMRYGKDLEVAVYKEATGADYNRTTPPAGVDPTKNVLIFKNNTKRTYNVRLDDKEIDEGALDAGRAQMIAEQIVQTLYSGAFKEENETILSLFSGATSSGTVQIVNLGEYDEPNSETAAKSLLYTIKNAAKYIREGDTSVNPTGLHVPAGNVKMIIPVQHMTGVDVYGRLDYYNEEYSRFDVDEVYTYIPASSATPAIYIFDDRFAQISKVHEDSYKEQPVAGCDNVIAYLHRYIQYAACPLFGAVKLTMKSGA